MKAWMQKQPWLESSKMDGLFILLPSVIPLFLIILFRDYFTQHQEVSTFWWVLLVMNIDVAHVYSTLFRFYWDRETYLRYKSLLLIIPICAFVVSAALHWIDALLFWRVIAYLAVFHFVRQQYGFMRLYSRKEDLSKSFRLIDSLAVYSATLYPLLYWHLHLTDDLYWFVKGDFIQVPDKELIGYTSMFLYVLIAISYVVKEIYVYRQSETFNLPKNLLIAGTYASWYLGIVVFRGDLIFTLFNVIAHGIPYMALVYFFSRKKVQKGPSFIWQSVVIFVLTIVVLAYLEEGLWDGLVWRDHEAIFPVFDQLPFIENPLVLSLVVPLLALPQITHYVLDGFIWKIRKTN